MQFYFDPATLGFRCDAVHNDIPSSAVAISQEIYFAMMEGQSRGQSISADSSGSPILMDRPPATSEELVGRERRWRDARITETDYLAMADYPLTDTQRSELYAYRQALRDWPAMAEFPTSENRPQPPAWLVQVLGLPA